ncbi:MAG: type II toxin-antitoxin system PemK/MazF family toxin [Lactobacillaceae bacterium]|jgi:mRNA interferase MazF|nr:type II toxin-antitoxin system PemK/MazF family toxin [Lactobacillaceae bacterium]
MKKNQIIKRGDIFYANLDPKVGSEQGGERPVLIIQNDKGNANSPTVIIAAITTSATKAKLPTHVFLKATDTKIAKDSLIMLEQVRTVDKKRLENKIDEVSVKILNKVNKALKVSLEL